MTLAQLKTACAAYVQKTTGDLTINSVDLFLVAANNARKNGELLHDFEHARVTATLSIDGVSGASLTSAVITSDSPSVENLTITGTLTPDATGTFVYFGQFGGYAAYWKLVGTTAYFAYYNAFYQSYIITTKLITTDPLALGYWGNTTSGVEGTYTNYTFSGTPTVAVVEPLYNGLKSIVAVSRQRPDGTWIPLDFARVDIPIERDRTELEFSDNLFPYLRYPSDAQINARGTNSSIVQRGNSLYIHPRFNNVASTTFAVQLEAFAWLRDYVAADLNSTAPTDFFLSNGFSYLQWATICELNYLFGAFVPRQEGVLAPPEKMRDDAWQRFLLWDSYLVDANTTRSR